MEEGIPIGGHSNVDGIGDGAPSRVVVDPILPPKHANTESSKKRLLNQVLLSTYVPPQERIHPPAGMVAPDLEGAREINHHWSPFNQAKPPIVHMRDLYPNYFRVLVEARAEQYSVPFPVYMDKEAFQLVKEDRMLICNQDFHRLAGLVRVGF